MQGLTFYEKLERSTDEQERHELQTTITIAEAIREYGGRAYVVGGYVRDEVLRQKGLDCTPKDIDIEIFGIEFEELRKLLFQSRAGIVHDVGFTHKVIKFEGLDISVPRKDIKFGTKHREFLAEGHPEFSIQQAAARRDLTINALSLDPLTGEIIDEVGGLRDIEQGILRAVDAITFQEDSLRVLRVMQFAGRFGFTIEPDTVNLCRSIDLSEIPIARIGEEWRKLFAKSPKPSVGLEAAKELGILEKLHPELDALIDCPQNPDWHPEGDVWTHTKMTVDKAATIVRREGLTGEDAQVLMLAALAHDFGKPSTTEYNTEKQAYTAYDHDTQGVEPARRFMKKLETPHKVIQRVLPLVHYHLYPAANPNVSTRTVRRLATRLAPASIQELVWVSEADQLGRGTNTQEFVGAQLLQKAAELQVTQKPQKQLVSGRHLIDEGIQPGPAMGALLKQLYEAQQDGEFEDAESGLLYYRTHLK